MITTSTTAVLIILTAIAGMLGAPLEQYHGAMVVVIPELLPGSGFQLNGFIFIEENDRHNLPHEYGHFLQQGKESTEQYLVETGIPSLIACALYVLGGFWNPRRYNPRAYRQLPWELEADRLRESLING